MFFGFSLFYYILSSPGYLCLLHIYKFLVSAEALIILYITHDTITMRKISVNTALLVNAHLYIAQGLHGFSLL